MNRGYYYSTQSLEWIFGAVFAFIVFNIMFFLKGGFLPGWMILCGYGMLFVCTIILSIFTYIYRETTLAKYFLNEDNIEIKYKNKLLNHICINNIISYKEIIIRQRLCFIIYYYDEEKNVQEATFEYRTVLSNYLEIKIPDKKEKNNE